MNVTCLLCQFKNYFFFENNWLSWTPLTVNFRKTVYDAEKASLLDENRRFHAFWSEQNPAHSA